jgi:hypothetical protein
MSSNSPAFDFLENKFNSIESQIVDLKHIIQINQLDVEAKVAASLTEKRKAFKLNNFRDRQLDRVNEQMIEDLDKLAIKPATSLRNVALEKYLNNVYLHNECFFGRLKNEERLLITSLTALQFVKYLKYLNLDNSRKTQLKLEYISFLIGKLNSNDYLESNCVSFEFLRNSNVLVNYKTMLEPNSIIRNLEIINSNSAMLYSTSFLQPSAKFFKLKVDHVTNESIYVLNRYKHDADDYIFEQFNLRLELTKSFRIINCIKKDFARVRCILDDQGPISDLLLFTFHVYNGELLISLKRRFKTEFFYLIYDLDRAELELKTVMGSFQKLGDKRGCTLADETGSGAAINVVNLDKTVTSLITFTGDTFFFINEARELLILSRASGEVTGRINFGDFVIEADFYFDFKSGQMTFFVQHSVAARSKQGGPPALTANLAVPSAVQQPAWFMVYNFEGRFLYESHFGINILNKFYKIFFKSYFRTGLSTRVFFKYPTLNV